MFGLLHQYLVENRSVYLRGTGQLQLVHHPALFDVTNNLLHPPHTLIQFKPNQQAGSLQPLMVFLSYHLQVAEEHAISLYELFCNQLQKDIAANVHVQWHNLGVFTKDAVGATVFDPDVRLIAYNQPVAAHRVIRQNTTHSIIVGANETTNTAMQQMLYSHEPEAVAARWWIPALVLGIIAILLIVLKKMQYL